LLKLKLVTWATTLFFILSYLLCVVYGLLTPSGIHMHQFLELVLPAFQWISVGSFFLGLAETLLWGIYFGGGYVLVYNVVHRRLSAGNQA